MRSRRRSRHSCGRNRCSHCEHSWAIVSRSFDRFLFSRRGLGIITLAGLFLVLVWAWVPAEIDPDCSLGENGAWISVDWTSEPVDQAAVEQLAHKATAYQLDTLLPFVTYVKADGSFSRSYDHAVEFVSVFRQCSRETRLLAWIGIPLRNDGGLGVAGWVDLSKAVERRRIVEFVIRLLMEADFDGVHLDAETVGNHNPAFLLLLDEIRAAIGPSRMLSVAGNDWRPRWVNSLPVVGGYKWDGDYYRQVGQRVDQVAVMSYDSLMPHPALYRLWMREQVRGISKSLSGLETELLFGLSVSREETTTHRPQAENMGSGLAGICAGLSRPSKKSHAADGVAIYAAWEANEADWRLWQAWLR